MTVHVSLRRLALFMALAAVSAGAAPAAAQAPARESTTQIARRMVAKEQIERLLLEYGRALDARDFTAYSNLFASDGEWIGGFGSVKGPANIKAFMEKNMGTGGNPTNNYHLLSNFVITVTGDTATAWSRWAFVQPQDRGAVIAQAGRYDDTFVKENGVWKFKKRVASNDTGRPPQAQVRPLTAPPSESPSSK
ncbi:MAG TPA: nuclear transport factor 2 family protein [Vicinamibacterales bacterium]|nr:nuclear transport factor 2 family protein [Vicinamibacterales bacterium]